MKTLITGGTIVSPEATIRADLLVDGRTIAAIGPDLQCDDAQKIDARGSYLFPGFIDPHTYLDMDAGTCHTADTFKTGSLGAIAGGTTLVMDFATQDKGQTLQAAAEAWHAMADDHSSCDYAFHMAITDWNATTRDELSMMTAQGITSYKLYMAYDALRVSDAQIFEVMQAAQRQGALVSMHCENGDLVTELIAEQKRLGHTGPAAHPLSRPDYVEAEAVDRFLTIAEAAGTPAYVVHLSTARGLEACRRARARGQEVYIETCPQYLILDDSCYHLPGFESAKYVFAPPARKAADRDALWAAIAAGEIDTIGSDHCSFNYATDKALGRSDFSLIPNGMPGVETRPVLMYTHGVATGRMTLEQMADLLSARPAKLFGCYPQKGVLAEGSDADIVIWDPRFKGTLSQSNSYLACDYSPYEGMAITGQAKAVILGGHLVVDNGLIVQRKVGQYVARKKVI